MMTRCLIVNRTAVAPDDEPAYLAARRLEAGRFNAAGDHLWLFRHQTHPGVFLEFRESTNPERLTAADPEAELWIEAALD